MNEHHPLWHGLKKYLVAGLLIWIPIAVTLFVLQILVTFVDQTLLLIPTRYRPEALLGFHIPGLGIVLALIVLSLTGMLVAHLMGDRLVAALERQIGRIPLVGSIYRGSKQLTETVLAPGSKAYRKVVLVRWPHRDSYALAFVTGSSLGEVQEKTEKEVLCVFVPTTPNPTSGFILMVPGDDVIELEMTVDEAFRMVVSLGVVVPVWPRKAASGQPAVRRTPEGPGGPVA
jgi:uncharacterized membrane protein